MRGAEQSQSTSSWQKRVNFHGTNFQKSKFQFLLPNSKFFIAITPFSKFLSKLPHLV
jgi:hypothetical protein